MRLTSEAKKKIQNKRNELRNLRGELSEEQDKLDTDLDENSYEKINRNIERLKNKIEIIKEELTELGDTQDELYKAQKKLTIKEEAELILEMIDKHDIGYLIEDKKYVYCLQMAPDNNNGIINPQFRTIDHTNIVSVLNKMTGKLLTSDSDSIKKLFQTNNRDYYGMTGSFNDGKWNSNFVYNKMKIISKHWVQPSDDSNYNTDFDFLLYSVCGGKEENIDHLEKWIAYKWYYPERNANMPNLDIGGFPGGNGKGRLIELLKTIFTHGCVVPAALKELTDGFNASWETAVILYYDEPASNELPEGKLKNATGGEEQRIEKKGIDAYTADRNYNMIFTSNNINGVIKLAGTGSSGEDRRWSVMTTDKVMVDEIMKIGLTEDEAKIRTNSINNLIKNRNEVSKWLTHLLIKHDIENLEILHPLHGQDYKKRFDDQKDQLQLVFDQFLPILKHCGILTLDVLTSAIHELTNQTKISTQVVSKRFQRYLEQQKIKYEYIKKGRVDLTYDNELCSTVQKNHYRLETSNTEFRLEYTMFSNVVPNKNTKLLAQDFTLDL